MHIKHIAEITLLYMDGTRFYHTINHALEMIELFETGTTRGITIPDYEKPNFLSREADLLEAILAHDCVYEFGKEKGYNESESLHAWGRITGRSPDDYGVVEPLILATINHVPQDDLSFMDTEMVKMMIDLDLAGLGAAKEEFDRNSHNIKKEIMTGNPSLSDDEYRVGRNAFLQSMLDRDTIYHTEQFRNALEDKARTNIKWAMLE